MKILIVIDMQNDFVTGPLGSKEALNIVPAIVKKIKKAKREKTLVYFTQDTHEDDYEKTQEGKKLPVRHCIKDTDGWKIIPQLQSFVTNNNVFIKYTFGSKGLASFMADKYLSIWNKNEPLEIELVGVCTDICVISNALIIKAIVPEAELIVDASCCAGVTPETHKCALKTMKSCQIKIINE